ncbi:general substrate transporter [Penicillium canescens]|nr:general substrate transporter [Penicillium canescens]
MTGATQTKRPFFGLTGGWLTFLGYSMIMIPLLDIGTVLTTTQVACATDMSLFGYDQGVFSGVVITQDFLEVHDLVGPTKSKTLSTVAAIYDIGCFIGAIVAFIIGESLGRKNSIMVGTTIMAVGTILQAGSFRLAQMFVGRIVLG